MIDGVRSHSPRSKSPLQAQIKLKLCQLVFWKILRTFDFSPKLVLGLTRVRVRGVFTGGFRYAIGIIDNEINQLIEKNNTFE